LCDELNWRKAWTQPDLRELVYFWPATCKLGGTVWLRSMHTGRISQRGVPSDTAHRTLHSRCIGCSCSICVQENCMHMRVWVRPWYVWVCGREPIRKKCTYLYANMFMCCHIPYTCCVVICMICNSKIYSTTMLSYSFQ
jgi:hypothetical protein